MVYEFRDGAHMKGDAQEVGRELERIKDANGGTLQPANVVVASKPKGAVLHGYFEWDDKQAAVAYRVEQARHIIKAMIVVAEEGEKIDPTRAFVSVMDEERARSFVHIVDASQDPAMMMSVIEEAKRGLENWRDRYKSLKCFAKVFCVIEEAVA